MASVDAPRSASLASFRARLPLVAAVVLFTVLAVYAHDRVFAFSEELMLHTTAHVAQLARAQPDDGPLAWEPSCSDAPPPRVLLSPDRRPTLSVCFGGRRYPLVVASYMSGYFYWPFALLSPLHHDDVGVLRRLALVFGLLDLWLTYRVARRLAGRRFAGLAAVAIAATPCFVVTHATLVHFETLPWTFSMAAVLVLLDCPALAPRLLGDAGPQDRVPTARILAAALLAGLALAANLKAVFVLLPIAGVALRFGVRAGRVRPIQWAGALAAAALPLAPIIAFAAGHPSLFLAGDKSGDMGRALRDNLTHLGHFASTARDMLAFWSNLGRYMDPTGRAPLNVVAYGCALVALLVVLVEGARALMRGQGSPIVAACAAILVTHFVMLALLVQSYPTNFTPLHATFGLAVACAADTIARSRPASRLRAAGPIATVAGAAAVIAPFAVSSVQTVRAFYDMPAPFNLHAERGLLSHLASVDAGDGQVHTVSTENLLTGVIESMSGGRIAVAEAQDYLAGCRQSRDVDERDRARSQGTGAECFAGRYRRLLVGLPDDAPLRFVLAADLGVLRDRTREGAASGMRAGLLAAAQSLGRDVALEGTFLTASGVPAIVLYRVDPPPRAADSIRR